MLIEAPARLAEQVTGGTRRVGVRVPAHDVARAVCRASNSVLTATSANPSGQPASDDPDTVAGSLASCVDMLLDAGRTPGGAPSTIIDVTDATPRVIRQGAIPWESIQSCLGLLRARRAASAPRWSA